MSKLNAAQKLAAELSVQAKAATPGPWIIDGDFVNEHGNVLSSYIANGRRAGGRIAASFANCLVKTDEQCRANAAFIAGANPKAVLVLTAEIENLLGRANYWKQRAKSAEGHICSSDNKAAAMALQTRTESAGEDWEKLSGCQRAKLLTAAAIVIGTVNTRRDSRKPKHAREEVEHG